jgi:DNA-binding GntR family transcriptional regulator
VVGALRRRCIGAIGLLEMREVLDGLAARLAAQAPPPSEGWDSLIEKTKGLRGAGQPFQPDRVFRADGNFHLAMVELAGNPYLARQIPLIRMSILTLYRRMPADGSRIDDAVTEHLEILEAIIRRDGDAAETLARAHIRRAVKYWLR